MLSILRIVTGFLFIEHGLQKVFGLLGGEIATKPQMVVGGYLELIGGALMILGLFTRFTAFILAGMMAVAYFQFHGPNGFWPVVNKGESAVLYCFVFLFFAVAGGGPWSLDAMLGKRRR
jgi:putative oxidoreductase